MEITYAALNTFLSHFLWAIPRSSGLFLSLPVLGSSLLPTRIRMALVFALAFLMMPFVPSELSLDNFEPSQFLFITNELLLGLLMGFILQLVFQVFIMGGQVIAMQAGLGFATLVDPSSGSSVPFISQFYQMMVFLLFLALNGHLVLLETLMLSFQYQPIGHLKIGLEAIGSMLAFSGWMFQEAVLIALPAILALLIVNLAFGVMTRVAPQLNLFSLGFPITLIAGFILIYLDLEGINEQVSHSLMQGMLIIKKMVH